MKQKKEKIDIMYKLPSFLIIGEARCGTTSLYEMITQHPKIAHAKRKELYFLVNANWNKKDMYKHRLGSCKKDQIIGEATPMYMWRADIVIDRVKYINPNTKLIVCFRNPVSKIYSHFMLRQQYYKLTLKENLKLFMQEASKYLSKKPCNKKVKTFFDRAKYAIYLKKWLDKFPRNQFKIIQTENLYKYPKRICNEIFTFLGLEFYDVAPIYTHKLKYLKMPKEFKDRLLEYFEPYNKQLYKLLNKNFNWEKNEDKTKKI